MVGRKLSSVCSAITINHPRTTTRRLAQARLGFTTHGLTHHTRLRAFHLQPQGTTERHRWTEHTLSRLTATGAFGRSCAFVDRTPHFIIITTLFAAELVNGHGDQWARERKERGGNGECRNQIAGCKERHRKRAIRRIFIHTKRPWLPFGIPWSGVNRRSARQDVLIEDASG